MSKGQFQGQVIENMIPTTTNRNITAIPNFQGISTGRLIYSFMFVIQGDLQGQKVNSKGQFLKILFLLNKNSSKCYTYFLCDFE